MALAQAVLQSPAQGPNLARFDRLFYLAMTLMMLGVVVVGFGPHFFFAPFIPTQPLRPIVYVHGAMFTSWMVLFALQTSLVSTGRVRIHRRLGVIGAVLLLGLLIVGSMTVVDSARHRDILVVSAVDLFGSFALLFVAATLIGAGLWNRGQPELHKRLMLTGTLALAQAGLGRITPALHSVLAEELLTFVYFFIWLGYDVVTRRRIWVAPAVGAAMAALIPPMWIPLIARSGPWLAFTAWVVK